MAPGTQSYSAIRTIGGPFCGRDSQCRILNALDKLGKKFYWNFGASYDMFRYDSRINHSAVGRYVPSGLVIYSGITDVT